MRVGELDAGALSYSYAHVLGQPRRTLGDDEGRLRSIPSVDMPVWTPTVHASVFPVVGEVEQRLRAAFPEYQEPASWTMRSEPREAPQLRVAP